MQTTYFAPGDEFPGSSVTLKPLTSPYIWDLHNTAWGGQALFAAFAFCVTDWKHAPLLGGKFAEEYDSKLIFQVEGGFAFDVVTEAARLASLTEDEIKNSNSPSTSVA